MVDQLKNLKEYVDDDEIYKKYLKDKDAHYSDFDLFCIRHVEDIIWAVDELEALYGLAKEMREKYETIKAQQKTNDREN